MTREQIDELVELYESQREGPVGADPNLTVLLAGVFVDAAPEVMALLREIDELQDVVVAGVQVKATALRNRMEFPS